MSRQDRAARKLYAWEDAVVAPRDRSLVPFAQLQSLVDHVWQAAGRHFPPRVKPLPKQARGTVARASRTVIECPPQLPSWILLHEIAHALIADVDGNGLDHGPEFVRAYVDLLVQHARLDRGLLEATLAAQGIARLPPAPTPAGERRSREDTPMTLPRRSLAALLALAARPARADGWPPASLRLIVPYPPGGVGDLTARLLAQSMGEAIPTRIVVDNRGGGATVPGTRAIQTAAPDGTTIGLVDNAFAINVGLLGAALPYDPLRDFAFISHVAAAPMVLVVHPSLGVADVQGFIALARRRGDTLAFGSGGNGTPVHIAGELFRRAVGIAWTHAPYRGAGPMMADLVAGNVQVAFATVPTALEHARAGRIRVLAASGRERPALMPEVPSMAEAGLPDVSIRVNMVLIGPPGLPATHVEGLAAAARRALAEPAVRDRLASLGLVPIGSTPAEARALFADEIAQMTRLIREANIRAE